MEDKEVELNNGIIDIVINLKGELNGTREEFKELIGYMGETRSPKECKSSLVHKIHAEVERANQDPELRRIRMTVQDKYLQIERNSREEGVEETLSIIKMMNDGSSVEEIVSKLDLPLEYIESIISRSK